MNNTCELLEAATTTLYEVLADPVLRDALRKTLHSSNCQVRLFGRDTPAFPIAFSVRAGGGLAIIPWDGVLQVMRIKRLHGYSPPSIASHEVTLSPEIPEPFPEFLRTLTPHWLKEKILKEAAGIA